MALPTYPIKRMVAYTRKAIWDAINAVSAAAELRLAALEVGATSQVVVSEYTNPIAADAAGLQALTATTVAPRTVLAAAMLAPGIAELDARPRNITITTAGSTASDAPATAVVTGIGPDGNAQTETLTVPQTATIVAGAKCFKGTGLSVAYAAGDGTGATNSIGFGVKMALTQKIKSRAGRLAVIQEVAAGSVVTNGTFVSPTTSPPYGSYAPNTAQDGANDYSVTYEHDLT